MLQVPGILHRMMQNSDDLNPLVCPHAIEQNVPRADYAAVISLQYVD